MAKTYVRLKDTTGSFYVVSQHVSINRTQIVEVESDSIIAEAINQKALVEVSKDDFDAYTSERQAKIDELAAANATPAPAASAAAAPTVFVDADAQKLLDDATAKGSIVKNANGTVTFGKITFDDADEFKLEVIDNEKLRAEVVATLSK